MGLFHLLTPVRIFIRKTHFFIIVLLIGTLLTAGSSLSNKKIFTIDPDTLDKAEKKYGRSARSRLAAWEELIQQGRNIPSLEQLEKVNLFFNRMNFVSDIHHWHKNDYWASPVEFLASDGGDCEDFSVAKYFTLKAMGMPEAKLKLTYVKALKLNQAHMVMTYYAKPGAEPLILDNLINSIKPASQRTDLFPIYSFNGSGLWLAKQRGQGKLVGKSDRLKLWQDLLQRIPNNLH